MYSKVPNCHICMAILFRINPRPIWTLFGSVCLLILRRVSLSAAVEVSGTVKERCLKTLASDRPFSKACCDWIAGIWGWQLPLQNENKHDEGLGWEKSMLFKHFTCLYYKVLKNFPICTIIQICFSGLYSYKTRYCLDFQDFSGLYSYSDLYRY